MYFFFFFFFRLKFSEKKFKSRKESTAKLSLSRILELVGGRTVTQVIIHHNRSTIFLFPPLGVICKFSLPDRLSLQLPGGRFFSLRAGVLVLWWEGRQRRHGPMLLFISILSCVWIWLQVAKSIFSFCGQHHRRAVYFFWAPPHLLPMSCAVASVCCYREGKQTMSLQSWSSESGERVASVKPWFAARSQTCWCFKQFEGNLNGFDEGSEKSMVIHKMTSFIFGKKKNKAHIATYS